MSPMRQSAVERPITMSSEFLAIAANAREQALSGENAEEATGPRRSSRFQIQRVTMGADNQSQTAQGSDDFVQMVTELDGPDFGQSVPAMVYAVTTSGVSAPRSYRQAQLAADNMEWQGAMEQELRGFTKHQVYQELERSQLPPGAEILRFMWLYNVKLDDQGRLMKRKARAVVLGNQQSDTSVGDTFSGVVKLDAFRTILSVAAAEGLELFQLDVEQAFLHGTLPEPVFVWPPEGASTSGKVWKLVKSVYGLRQAPKIFNDFLNAVLIEMGYKRLRSDECVYVLRQGKELSIVGLHVDDLLVAVSKRELFEALKAGLRKVVEIKDLGHTKTCLGLQINQDVNTGNVTVRQSAFVEEILAMAGMSECAPVGTPFAHNVTFSPNDCSTTENQKAAMRVAPFNLYGTLVGKLQYLVSGCRPDIALAVNYLSRHVSNYGPTHFTALKHLLRYLKGTKDKGLTYCGRRLQGTIDEAVRVGPLSSFSNALVGYSDSDWGRDLLTRRSTGGYCFFLNGCVISWRVRAQKSVALSTSEAELMALCDATKHAVWLRRLLAEMGFGQQLPTVMYEDNQGSIAMVQHDVFHDRSKHMDLRYHYVREQLAEGVVSVIYCPTSDMMADLFTKPLGPERIKPLVDRVLGCY